MAIEIKEQFIAKDGLVDKLNELFISTSEYTEQHMDVSHCDGMIFARNREKKIPFVKFQNLQTRQTLRKDFNDFLKSYHIQEEQWCYTALHYIFRTALQRQIYCLLSIWLPIEYHFPSAY